jgi:uncharacterized membrane protein YphA (DoxX/SURF4 family)
MQFESWQKYKAVLLRVFLGLTVMMWGYEKLTLEKLQKSYSMDYGFFLFFDVNVFLTIAGVVQIVIGLLLIIGAATRINALLVALMGLITIIIPGFIIMRDVPHFAYAFALTGGALTLLIEGSGDYSVDKKLCTLRGASQ